MEACNVGSLDEDEAYLLVHAFSEFAVGRGGRPLELHDLMTSTLLPILSPSPPKTNKMGGSPLANS